MSIDRRALLTASLAGVGVTVLSACQVSNTTPTPSPTHTFPTCISLGEHTFARGRTFCGDPSPSSEPTGNMAPIDHHGPLVLGEGTLVSQYIDAVLEWDLTTGQARRLLAPRRSDSWCYAHRGRWTITPRCDAGLVVHENGCAVGELLGHSPVAHPGGSIDGIQALDWADDDHLFSLGTDGTLRRWSVPDALQQAVITPALDAPTTLSLGWSEDTVLVSGTDRVELFDVASLESLTALKAPAATSGWMAAGTGTLAGMLTDGRGVLVWDVDSGAQEVISTTSRAALECLPDGRVVVVSAGELTLRTPDGGITRVPLDSPSHYPEAVLLSPDGVRAHVLDQLTGVRTLDLATGNTLTTFQDPAPW